MNKPITIGITHGDFNGVGYEVILKTFSNSEIYTLMTPVVYGSPQALTHYSKLLALSLPVGVHLVANAHEAQAGKLNIVATDESGIEVKPKPGEPSRLAGTLAARALRDARRDLSEGGLCAVVTAPINKDAIQSRDFTFKGHTEFFGAETPDKRPLMLFVSQGLRVALATTHLPLQEVSKVLTTDLIVERTTTLAATLKQDFGINNPRIALLGLNPHCGEQGIIGTEEMNVILPALEQIMERKIWAFGPFAADGFWGSGAYDQYDAILAMYHDQGLIPFKLLAMESGVNVTCGLPIVRTSPDHGTAYDIAGQGIANPDSFRNALYTAIDIYRERQRNQELAANPLKRHYYDRGKDNVKLDLSKSVDEE